MSVNAATAELRQILDPVAERPTLSAYTQAARALRSQAAHLQTARVALLSSFTIDPLLPYLEVESAHARLSIGNLRRSVQHGPSRVADS